MDMRRQQGWSGGGQGASARMTRRAAWASPLDEGQLLDTQRAFDSVAADYDGPRGNNELIQRMRVSLWETVLDVVPAGSHLLDLGCGTGIDAIEFARCGYQVAATDWSPQMVGRTRSRAAVPRGRRARNGGGRARIKRSLPLSHSPFDFAQESLASPPKPR